MRKNFYIIITSIIFSNSIIGADQAPKQSSNPYLNLAATPPAQIQKQQPPPNPYLSIPTLRQKRKLPIPTPDQNIMDGKMPENPKRAAFKKQASRLEEEFKRISKTAAKRRCIAKAITITGLFVETEPGVFKHGFPLIEGLYTHIRGNTYYPHARGNAHLRIKLSRKGFIGNIPVEELEKYTDETGPTGLYCMRYPTYWDAQSQYFRFPERGLPPPLVPFALNLGWWKMDGRYRPFNVPSSNLNKSFKPLSVKTPNSPNP